MSVSRFRPASDGRAMDLDYRNKKASTVIVPNTLLTLDSSGQLIPAVAASLFTVGVAVQGVTASDPNYAAVEEIQFDSAKDGDEFIMDVNDASTAGFVAGVERALVNAGQIKAAAPSSGEGRLVRIVKVLTGTNQAIVQLITNADSQNT
jgi:hypothetical protein